MSHMRNSRLILAGDRTPAKAVRNYMGICFGTIVPGFLLLVFGAYVLPSRMYLSPTTLRYADLMQLSFGVLAVLGGILLLAGIATPLLAFYQSKKCFVDVYEGFVEGTYLARQKGSVDQYIPFHLGYDKIDGVMSKKSQVFILTSSGTLPCFAFNADEICKEIRARCGQV